MSDNTDPDQARHDLESALTDIGSVAKILMDLGECRSEGSRGLNYLGHQLYDHERQAFDAFCRIFRLDDYADSATGGAA
jgi:hypothetical protein